MLDGPLLLRPARLRLETLKLDAGAIELIVEFEKPPRLVESESTLLEALREGLAGDELHHEEPFPIVLFERVERRDSWVLNGRERLGLSLQPLQSRLVVRERLGKDLQGDVATETMIPDAIDLALYAPSRETTS